MTKIKCPHCGKEIELTAATVSKPAYAAKKAVRKPAKKPIKRASKKKVVKK